MNEIKHHGVMGMKWGVRRYQNKDGSLTPAGKARFKKVEESKYLQKRDTKTVVRNLKTTRFTQKPEYSAAYYNKKAKKAREEGNTEKMKKYIASAKHYTKMGKYIDKRLSDIESGKIKAGRDFIVQRDYDVYPWFTGIIITKHSTMIEKKK